MKKIAIIAALTLAIGASMTAGTMARYTQNIGDVKANITAKKFNAELEVREKMNFVLQPGMEKQVEEIVVNTSELETLTNLAFRTYGINTDFFKALDDAGVKINLTANGNEVTLEYDKANDVLYGHYLVQPGTNKVVYQFSLEWSEKIGDMTGLKDDDKLTEAIQGQNFDFNVNIHATQN